MRLAGEQVADGERRRQAELVGHDDDALVRLHGIEVNADEDGVARRPLGVGDQVLVLGLEEVEAVAAAGGSGSRA